jgi:NAD(P)-dependent dehydrogenase (short-subunit alcohol dehydrogenase family)
MTRSPNLRLDGKSAAIVGGASGIGLAFTAGALETTSAAYFERAMLVNVSSAFGATHAVAGHMRDARGGVILNQVVQDFCAGVSRNSRRRSSEPTPRYFSA